MTQLQPSLPRTLAARRAFAASALLALVLCASAGGRAQSGRHAPKPATGPTPESTPQGESESKPRGAAAKPSNVVASFVVMQYDDPIMGVDFRAREAVLDNFVRRLGQSRSVAVTTAGKGTRKEARARAKEAREAFVVLFQLEEETAASGGASIGNVDSRTLLLKTYVYAPQTGDLKFADTIFQRPYRPTTSIGGVRVPVPSRRIEQYPSQLQLEQAARDAADRLLSRFSVIIPPDN
jgi:hypothetical protein